MLTQDVARDGVEVCLGISDGFVALHAQQSWGNWGGLVSIAAAGVVLTALRIVSGSVLVPALAHVLYNFALSMRAFW